VVQSGSAKATPIKARINATVKHLKTPITMLRRRNAMLWRRVQGKEPQCSKFPSSNEGERGSSFKVEREALLLFKAKGKKLCIENWLEEMDLV